MTILAINGSPRKNGNVAKNIKNQIDNLTKKYQKKHIDINVIYHDISDLNFSFCKGCMACREKSNCILPNDDAHLIGQQIQQCDYIIVGSPVYWGNINGKLKSLFDRLVYVLMGESKLGIPLPLQKGKKAIIVTSCTTPFPFNYLCRQTTGAVAALKEILKTAGFKIVKCVNISGTKKR